MIIFNADDFGLTKVDVSRVMISISNRVIKSTTVITNKVSDIDLANLRSHKDVSIGLHVNLVEGYPMLPNLQTLVQTDGTFFPKREFVCRLLLGLISIDEISDEIGAQIAFLRERGIAISHLDTHQNMHCISKVLHLIIEQMKSNGIPKIRGLTSEYFWFRHYSYVKSLLKKGYIQLLNYDKLKKIQKSDRIILNAPGLGFACHSIEEALTFWDYALTRFYNKNFIYEVPCHLYLSEFEYILYNSKEFLGLLSAHDVKIGNFNDF